MSQKLTFDLILSEMNIKSISNLVSINIVEKNINDISILSQIPTLEIINLNNNDITNLSVFKNLKNIKKLSLKGNKINDFSQIEFLRYCPKLEYLKLKENPIAKEKNYLMKICEILPKLKILDDKDINLIKNKEQLINQVDNKKKEENNDDSNKYIKLKPQKIKNNFKFFNPNEFKASQIIPQKIKIKNNSNIINQINNDLLNGNNNQNNNKKEINNNIQDKEKINKEKEQNNEEDDFEIININDEKKKIEKENKKYQKIEPKPKNGISSYSFKKKSSIGSFIFDSNKKKEKNKFNPNMTLENFNINKNMYNTFNEEQKNVNSNFTISKYSRKIIGKFHGHNNALSQSFRYDDMDGEENYNTTKVYSKKNKLGSLKNRILNNLTNKIYNKSKNNTINNNKESEKEKIIIKSINLLMTNLDEEGLNQLNKILLNIIDIRTNK